MALPISGPIAVLDVSKSCVGIVISDDEIKCVGFTYALKPTTQPHRLGEIYARHRPTKTFVGLSTDSHGNLSDSGRFTKQYTHQNRKILGEFEFINEYNTTKKVKELLPIYQTNQDIGAAMVMFLGLL